MSPSSIYEERARAHAWSWPKRLIVWGLVLFGLSFAVATIGMMPGGLVLFWPLPVAIGVAWWIVGKVRR